MLLLNDGRRNDAAIDDCFEQKNDKGERNGEEHWKMMQFFGKNDARKSVLEMNVESKDLRYLQFE